MGEFSYPIVCSEKQVINYINSIDIYLKKKKIPDLILVDGRFRIACCLNLLTKIGNKRSTIVLDDYKERKEYHYLNNFFEVKKIGRLGILKPKRNLKYNNNIIETFYLNCK